MIHTHCHEDIPRWGGMLFIFVLIGLALYLFWMVHRE